MTVAGLPALRGCLDSIGTQGLENADAVMLLVSGQLSEKELHALDQQYSWLTLKIMPEGTSYALLKADSADLVESQILVMCDCDCQFQENWLYELLGPFRRGFEADLAAGETTTLITGPYSLAIALTYIFPRFSGENACKPSQVYWANNFAVRRELFIKLPVPDFTGLFRGQNIIHSQSVTKIGGHIWRTPRARAVHVLPSPGYLTRRYYWLGRDCVNIARLSQDGSGGQYSGAFPPDVPGDGRLMKLFRRTRLIARQQPAMLLWLPLAAPVVFGVMCAYLAGLIAARAGKTPTPAVE